MYLQEWVVLHLRWVIRCCKRRYRNHDQDNCYPDQRIRNQMQCRISWNRGHTGQEEVYNHSVGQGRLPDGKLKDVAKAIIYLLADSPAVYDRTVLSTCSQQYKT